jgi:hypothetical protein
MWTAFSRLGTYLAGRGRAGERRVTLTLGELEALLGRPLPRRARVEAAWWRNTSHPWQAGSPPWYGWLSVGWEAEPDLPRGAVTFCHRRQPGHGGGR